MRIGFVLVNCLRLPDAEYYYEFGNLWEVHPGTEEDVEAGGGSSGRTTRVTRVTRVSAAQVPTYGET